MKLKMLTIATAVAASVAARPAAASYTGSNESKAGQSVSAYALLSKAAQKYAEPYDNVQLSTGRKIEAACQLEGDAAHTQREDRDWQLLKSSAPHDSRALACAALVTVQAMQPANYYPAGWSTSTYMLTRMDYAIAAANLFIPAARYLAQHAAESVADAQRRADAAFVKVAHLTRLEHLLDNNADWLSNNIVVDLTNASRMAANAGPLRAEGSGAGLTLIKDGVPFFDPQAGVLGGVDYSVSISASRSTKHVVREQAPEPARKGGKASKRQSPSKINIFRQ